VVNERLRIGDAEREAAARELGEHFALGRITADEHSERLEQIWAARTNADLAPTFRDLPRPRATPPPARPTAPAVRRDRGWLPDLPRIPFPFKLLVAIVAIWWGFHHLLFLLIGVVLYVVVVRRFLRRRRRWHGGPWGRGGYQTGWH
jgi:Flp pilus assembly protein TadB